MTNEIKNVPELRFPGFSGEWKKRRLGDIATTFSGGTPSSTDRSFYNGSISFIRSGEISKISTELKINEKAISKSSAKMVEVGDLLYALYGATSGEVAISKINGAINQAVLCIRSKESILYLFNYLTMKKGQILNTYIQGGQGNLSASIVKRIQIKLPCLFEQQKIGDFFSKLDQQIELEEQKLEKLEEQKKGYMQKIFSQELRFKDENGNEYPEWKERKFSELLSYSSNGVDKKINKNHDIAYMVNYMDVFKKTKLNTKNRDLLMEITATKIQKEKNNLKKGDILFTPSSETREDIAKSTVVFEDLDNTVYSYHLIRLRPLDSNIFSLKYSNYLSEQNFISKQFRRLAQGAQRYTLTKEYFENIKLNLPHIKEQEKIGDFFSKLDEVINKQSQKIDELKLRKQGFLQKMFV